MKNIIKFIKDDLKLKIFKTTLKHIISDKLLFLGFDIQMILSKKSNYFKDKKFKTYKKHKNIILKKGAQEYEKFLKMIE
jgi:hypothetical protein